MPTERELLNARIGELLHLFFVDIRAYTVGSGEPNRMAELNRLADLAHNLPRYIVGHDEHALTSHERLRWLVVRHVGKFYPEMDPERHPYVKLLDLDADTFLARYRDNKWDSI